MKKLFIFLFFTITFCFSSEADEQILLNQCKDGNGQICNAIAIALSKENPQDIDKMRDFFKKACDLNYTNGCFNLALLYDKGEDYEKAIVLYKLSCENGNFIACENVADMHENSLGIKRDDKEILKYLKKACDGKIYRACNELGNLYFYGEKEVTQDYLKTNDYYTLACENHYPAACNNLGLLFDGGLGVLKDSKRALELFDKACNENISFGCINAGVIYANAKDVELDLNMAKKYFLKACDLKNKNGCEKASRIK